MTGLAILMIVVALVVTGMRDSCPRHSDCFDTLVCPLCSIRLFRQQEIDEYCATFERGHNGGLFTEN